MRKEEILHLDNTHVVVLNVFRTYPKAAFSARMIKNILRRKIGLEYSLSLIAYLLELEIQVKGPYPVNLVRVKQGGKVLYSAFNSLKTKTKSK
ncbi:MAG: hypothetical protein KAT00_09540 [Planctomycetes bacterium]|nr:hypothetical protein [Planctomycetota bacterium]